MGSRCSKKSSSRSGQLGVFRKSQAAPDELLLMLSALHTVAHCGWQKLGQGFTRTGPTPDFGPELEENSHWRACCSFHG
jgi:hypothetical protein